jgi:hypothetical protein
MTVLDMTWSRLVSSRSRDVVFDLVVHMLWADGRVTPDELSAARGAANALGMDTSTFGGLFGRVGRPFEALGLEQLGPLERPLAYAAAVWMAMADRELAHSEGSMLRRLQRALSLDHVLSGRIEGMVVDAARAEGNEQPLDAEVRQRALESLLDRVAAQLVA